MSRGAVSWLAWFSGADTLASIAMIFSASGVIHTSFAECDDAIVVPLYGELVFC